MGKERLLERVCNDREVLMVGKDEDEGEKDVRKMVKKIESQRVYGDRKVLRIR